MRKMGKREKEEHRLVICLARADPKWIKCTKKEDRGGLI